MRMFLRRGQFKRHVLDRKAAEAAVEAERRRLEALRLREEAERAEQERLAKLEHAARVQALAERERAQAERLALEGAKARVVQRAARVALLRKRTSRRTEQVHKAAATGDVAALKQCSARDLALLQAAPGLHCPWPAQFTALLNNQVAAMRQLGWNRPAGHSTQSVLSMRDGRGNTALHVACSASPLRDATIVAMCEACEACDPDRPDSAAACSPKLGGATDKSLVSSLAPRARSEPLKSGWLSKKKEGNTWRRRWCVLTEDQLMYYKTPQDSVPKGVVPMLGCTFSRPTGSSPEGPTFELRSPHIKKSSFFGLVGAATGSILFLAETEADLLQWMTPARAVLGVEPLRQGKVTYADNARRGAILNAGAVNHLGQTALHLLAAQRTQEEEELLTAAAWVVSLGCPPDRQALDGRSAAQVAADNGHPSLHDFLQLATADSFSTAPAPGLLPKPVFYQGYTYLQLTFLTHSMRPGGR